MKLSPKETERESWLFRRRPCHFDNLGLDDDEVASLTGFTSRAAQAVAHLRDAWANADSSNALAIVNALRELFKGRSMQESRDVMLKVLKHDNERSEQLLEQLWPTDWRRR